MDAPGATRKLSATDYDNLRYLRRNHSTWRLLAADSAPLIVGFLQDAFTRPMSVRWAKIDAWNRSGSLSNGWRAAWRRFEETPIHSRSH